MQLKEKLNPKDNTESRTEFLKRFDWTDRLLTETEKQAVEDILFEYHDIFARHRMDSGMNTEFKVRLTPEDDKAVYSQSLPMPIHLKEYLIVEFALMHRYGIITVLPFSKYARPIFAQRKSNGKLRLLVNLRKINTLIADEYTDNIHPVSLLSDAAQHLAGKSLLCKLDCSQAYHCLQMADQRSVELLAFNFASGTFAYKRLAQGLSRSVSALSSFMREYLDPVVKADQCAQYMDDIGIAANNATELTRNIRAVFQCIRNARLKLTIEKCHFRVRQVEFLGRTISSEGVSPQNHMIQNFLNKLRFPKSKKALQWYLGFVNYYRDDIPRTAAKLNPFYKLLKAEVPINITSELKETFDSVNKALGDACQLALKQPIPGKKLVLLTDASFRSAGYALKIEDNPDQKIQSKRKTYAPVAFGSKNFLACTTKNVDLLKRIFGNLHGTPRICTHLAGDNETDNRSDGQRIRHTILPDQGNSTIFVERMWLRAAVQLQKITYRWFSKHSSWFLFTIRVESHGEDPSQDEGRCTNNTLWSRNILFRCRRRRTVFLHTTRWSRWNRRTDPTKKKTISWKSRRMGSQPRTILLEAKYQEFTKIDGKTTAYSLHGIKANARIRVEQDADLVLKNLELKILNQPHDDVLLTTDSRFKHYKAKEDRIIIKDGLLFRKTYGATGSVKYYQILTPKELVNEVLRSLHGEFGKHPGITKTIIAYRQKYYYPRMAQLIRE